MANRRRKKKRGKPVLVFVFLAIIGFGVLFLSNTVFFNIEIIEVDGESIYKDYEIIDKSGISIGDNLFSSNYSDAKKQILDELVYIDDVELKRVLPTSLVIEVEKAQEIAIIENNDLYLLVSSNLKVLENQIKIATLEKPLVVGMSIETPEIGTYLSQDEKGHYTALKDIIDALENNDFKEKLTLIDIRNPMDIKLYYDNRIEIKLASRVDMDYKIKFVKQIINEEITEYESGVLDATLKNDRNRQVSFIPNIIVIPNENEDVDIDADINQETDIENETTDETEKE